MTQKQNKGQTIVTKTANIQIRTTDEIKTKLSEKAKSLEFSNLSEYMIFVGLNADIKVKAIKKEL